MVIDTNILIAYLNGEAEVIKLISEWRQDRKALFISSVSVAEVLALPTLSYLETEIIQKFLKNFISVYFDDILAEQVAFFRRLYKISIPDAAIVATAFQHNTPLVTRDYQLRKIKEITIIKI